MKKLLQNEIILQNKITFENKGFEIGFNSDLNIYIMAVYVSWIAGYKRFYRIEEGDYKLSQTDMEVFCKKYSREIQKKDDCFTENFIGAEALRDYDGAKNFQYSYDFEGNPFQGYLYYNGILYARIVWKHKEIYVPPVRAIKLTGGKYRYPLRESCVLMKSAAGEPLCFALKVE